MVFGLTVEQLLAIVGVLGTAFVGLGKSVQWYVDRLDAKTQKAMETERELRNTIERSFEARIQNLEQEVQNQKAVIEQLHAERLIYLRRIYQLESYIELNNLGVPGMEGWPP